MLANDDGLPAPQCLDDVWMGTEAVGAPTLACTCLVPAETESGCVRHDVRVLPGLLRPRDRCEELDGIGDRLAVDDHELRVVDRGVQELVTAGGREIAERL